MLSVWEINQVLLQEKGDFFAVFPWFWSYFFSRGYSIICCPIVPLYQPRIECSQGRHLCGGRHVWSSRWHDQGWISHQGLFLEMCDLVFENEILRWFQQTAWIQATTRTRLFFERQGSWLKNTKDEQIVLFTWCFKYIYLIQRDLTISRLFYRNLLSSGYKFIKKLQKKHEIKRDRTIEIFKKHSCC